MVDFLFYNRILFAPLNILLYNVFSDRGPDLYGTEPWTFYLFNGLLNFNIAFVLALLSPVAMVLFRLVAPLQFRKSYHPFWVLIGPLFVWLAIVWPQAHKEERFLFVIYPFIALAGALTFDLFHAVIGLLERYLRARVFLIRLLRIASFLVGLSVLCGFICLSLSRIAAIQANYHAPLDIYTNFARETADSSTSLRLCVGKEWYRFPGHFFAGNHSVHFVRSSFRGMLPQHYSAEYGTSGVPPYFNDRNEEYVGNYATSTSCDYLIDQTLNNQSEPDYVGDTRVWTKAYCKPFLDASRSHFLTRAFYIPVLSEQRNHFNEYCLLRRNVVS